MRAIEGQVPQRDPADRNVTHVTLNRDASSTQRPEAQAAIRQPADSLASARAAFETQGQRVEAPRPAPVAERRPAEADDLIAGLEAAALQDIDAEIGK